MSALTTLPSQAARRNYQFLRAQITTYTFMVITALLLLMLLTWHFSTVQQLVEQFNMPPEWRAEFKRQQLGGLRLGFWVVVFVCVSWMGLREVMEQLLG